MKKSVYFLIVLLTMSCAGSYEQSADSDYAYAGETAYAPATSEPAAATDGVLPAPAPEKKIIKTGNMSVTVPDLGVSKARVDSLVVRFGGYYGSEDYVDGNNYHRYILQVRVPVDRYESFVAQVEKGPGKVTVKEIKAEDITEQFVDLETRLASKRSYLNRYRDLLKQAGNIQEILEIEAHIRKLEEEIESAEGRLRYLGDQTSYSSLRLVLQQDTPAVRQKSTFWSDLGDALGTGWNILVHIVLFIVLIWPLWLIAGVVLIWIMVRRKRKGKA